MRAERRNVVLDISEEEIEYYAAKGYDIYDGDTLIKKAPPTTIAEFRILLTNAEAKIAELETQIANLRAENKKLKAKKKKED